MRKAAVSRRAFLSWLLLYSALFYLFLPFICIRLLWRSIKAPAYRRRWAERFALYTEDHPQQVVWFHAVSVGESEALLPLLNALRKRHPAASLLVTTTTPTGSARIKAALGDSAAHVYLPYDLPDAMRRFVAHFKPRLAVIIEAEIWPNMLHACAAQAVPVFIVNARLSEKSARGYRKLSALTAGALAPIRGIAAQTQEDAQRFVAVGAQRQRVQVTGNIKFDSAIAAELYAQARQLRETQFPQRVVWIAGSTHKGEEELVLQVYTQLRKRFPALLLILVPRHPERFDEVYKLCRAAGLPVARRSLQQRCAAETAVYLGDTMGELKLLYAVGDVALVGGSLVPVGGHNVLEPAALGVPVVFGAHMANFREIAAAMLQRQAAVQCPDREALLREMSALLSEPQRRRVLAERGKIFVAANQGATERVLAMLEAHL
ncbi:MAG: lipid IV(A) 3-deoxy-D-manno-octulosonic acid transferase [Gammaproteobacteria bacterium]